MCWFWGNTVDECLALHSTVPREYALWCGYKRETIADAALRFVSERKVRREYALQLLFEQKVIRECVLQSFVEEKEIRDAALQWLFEQKEIGESALWLLVERKMISECTLWLYWEVFFVVICLFGLLRHHSRDEGRSEKNGYGELRTCYWRQHPHNAWRWRSALLGLWRSPRKPHQGSGGKVQYQKQGGKSMIAATILQQLGGRRFLYITGCKDPVSMGNGLRLKLARNRTLANRLDIIYDAGKDLYVMRFWRLTLDNAGCASAIGASSIAFGLHCISARKCLRSRRKTLRFMRMFIAICWQVYSPKSRDLLPDYKVLRSGRKRSRSANILWKSTFAMSWDGAKVSKSPSVPIIYEKNNIKKGLSFAFLL